MHILTFDEWHQAAQAHRRRLEPGVTAHLERRKARVSHPVEDFLFTYYSYRPRALMRWHPGFGVAMEGADIFLELPTYERRGAVITLTDEMLVRRRVLIETLTRLLRATAARPAQLGCFGLHEWAMVYRIDRAAIRHAAWPLRLGSAGTDEVVDSHKVACSHFDAFRFFTEPARALNVLQPRVDDRATFEQPGCLHAGMDLYKHAFRLSPLVSSTLVADCFELAREIRVLDMRASPYDLTDLGYDPVAIETTTGKADYVAAQRGFADRGQVLRSRLLAACESLTTMLLACTPADSAGAGVAQH